jgi:hypothetical protein
MNSEASFLGILGTSFWDARFQLMDAHHREAIHGYHNVSDCGLRDILLSGACQLAHCKSHPFSAT